MDTVAKDYVVDELYNNLGQSLSLVKLLLHGMEQCYKQHDALHAVALVQKAILDIRKIARQLESAG